MEKKKYEYSYEIVTKHGETITNRMKKGILLLATKESMAKKILDFKYPGCKIIHIKTKTATFIDTDMTRRGKLFKFG